MTRSTRPSITIDPGVMSGTPCLTGTRIPAYMVAEATWLHGVDEAQALWGLARDDVIVACWFTGAYGTVHLWAEPPDGHVDHAPRYQDDPADREWLERWRDWAQGAHGNLWNGDYDTAADPPTARTP